jgi:hypothetical protein
VASPGGSATANASGRRILETLGKEPAWNRTRAQARLAREHLKPALKQAGVTKPFRPFHDLRHTASPTKQPPATPSPTSR